MPSSACCSVSRASARPVSLRLRPSVSGPARRHHLGISCGRRGRLARAEPGEHQGATNEAPILASQAPTTPPSVPPTSQQPIATAAPQPDSPTSLAPPSPGPPSQGLGIAAGAVLAGVAAFAATSLLATGPSLASLEALSVPLDVALANGRPTVVEFYANWCEVCRELVPYEYQVQQQYGDKVNFVMLNVENSRWAEEAAEYRVGGIPHFVFLDEKGTPLAAAVGRLPPQVLEGNVSALAAGEEVLPYAAVRERTSPLQPPTDKAAPRQANPRDHA